MAERQSQSTQKGFKADCAEFLRGRHALMGFILLLVHDPHQAEDIFQDVWVALHDALQQGQVIEDQARWCRGVARNLTRQSWRREQGKNVILDSRLLERFELAFDEQDMQSDYWTARREALANCVDTLPEHSRRTLSLRYVSGLPIAAMAQQFQLTSSAVTKTLSRIRAALRECVDRKLEMESET